MNLREAIANALEAEHLRDAAMNTPWLRLADSVLAALTAAGYRIIQTDSDDIQHGDKLARAGVIDTTPAIRGVQSVRHSWMYEPVWRRVVGNEQEEQ
jgi:hypothetical protein